MKLIKTTSFELAVYEKGITKADKIALVLPGRLDTKDYPHTRSHVDFLASKGYYALAFDPPGTWESPGGIELYTMTSYLKAMKELIELLGNKPTVLVGHSRGGSMAMLGGTTIPQVTHFVAIMSRPSASIPDDETGYKKAGKDISYRDTPPNNSEHQVKFELPYSYFEDAAQYNMTEDLKSCTKPKLFFYGLQDKLVTPDSVKEMYEYAAEPKQIHELNSEHDYRKHPEIIEEVNEVISRFLNV
jgi:pimeloyl-ACP methyl ester carboxylesterase